MTSKAASRVLTDHDEIRRWAEERGAKPSTVRSTHSDDSIGIIRLDFPGYSGADSLEEIEWDEWFNDFDDNNLALVVQDETANGQKSNFNKIVSRENVEAFTRKSSGSARGKRAPSRGDSQSRKSSSTNRRESSSSRKSSGRGSTRKSTVSSSKSRSSDTRHRSRGKKAA